MSMQNFSIEKEKLEKKLIKERGKSVAMEFIAKLERLEKDELEAVLLDYSKTAQGLINTKNADETLNNLKAQVSERSRLHNEGIRRNKELQRLVSIIISEKFGDELMDLKTTGDLESEAEDIALQSESED